MGALVGVLIGEGLQIGRMCNIRLNSKEQVTPYSLLTQHRSTLAKYANQERSDVNPNLSLHPTLMRLKVADYNSQLRPKITELFPTAAGCYLRNRIADMPRMQVCFNFNGMWVCHCIAGSQQWGIMLLVTSPKLLRILQR